jgi:hypothetical protein
MLLNSVEIIGEKTMPEKSINVNDDNGPDAPVPDLFTVSGDPLASGPGRSEKLYKEHCKIKGRMLMADPGVYQYSGGPERDMFRSTAMHQCLTVNGMNAARAGRCLEWIEDDGKGNAVLTVENDSYGFVPKEKLEP